MHTLENKPTRAFQLVSDDQATTIIPPNEEMLKIARLFLEKYEILESVDKELFRDAITCFNSGRAHSIWPKTRAEEAV